MIEGCCENLNFWVFHENHLLEGIEDEDQGNPLHDEGHNATEYRVVLLLSLVGHLYWVPKGVSVTQQACQPNARHFYILLLKL